MKRKWKWVAGALTGLGVVGGAAFLAGRALADGIPATGALTYSGLLQDAAGAPLGGTHPIDVLLWDSATPGGTALCSNSEAAIELSAGRFSILLPDTCADAVSTHKDVWVEVKVDGVSLGTTKLGAVPYALEADHATQADTAAKAANADRLGGSAATAFATSSHAHAFGSLTGVPAGFSDLVDNDTKYSAGTGLDLNGTAFSADPAYLQRRVSATCAAGSSIRAIAADGTVTCETDDTGASTVTGVGSGLLLSGGTASADTTFLQRRVSTTCAVGSSIRAVAADGTVTCDTAAKVTAWTAFTPTVRAAAAVATGFNTRGIWRRVGDSVEVQIKSSSTATNASTARLSWTLPAGLTVRRLYNPDPDFPDGFTRGHAELRTLGVTVNCVVYDSVPTDAVLVQCDGISLPLQRVDVSLGMAVDLTFTVPVEAYTTTTP